MCKGWRNVNEYIKIKAISKSAQKQSKNAVQFLFPLIQSRELYHILLTVVDLLLLRHSFPTLSEMLGHFSYLILQCFCEKIGSGLQGTISETNIRATQISSIMIIVKLAGLQRNLIYNH